MTALRQRVTCRKLLGSPEPGSPGSWLGLATAFRLFPLGSTYKTSLAVGAVGPEICAIC